jgi:hypothetical protein
MHIGTQFQEAVGERRSRRQHGWIANLYTGHDLRQLSDITLDISVE